MERLGPHIKLLLSGRYNNLPYCNCLLIEDEINCLVDSSPSEEEMAHLQDINIDLIVNSHGHSDHNSRNYAFPGARVLLHPAEQERMVSGEAYLEAFGFSKFQLAEVFRPIYLEVVRYHARPADGDLADGQVISTGSVEFQVLHLPGHSGGHSGFIFPKEGFIFTADINPDDRPFYGMMDSSLDDYIASIERLLRLGPDMIVPGHGDRVIKDRIPARLTAYRNDFYEREEKILDQVKAGKHTIAAIAEVGIAYSGRLPNPRNLFLLHECMMDWKHLQRLERLGEVICHNGRYYIV